VEGIEEPENEEENADEDPVTNSILVNTLVV